MEFVGRDACLRMPHFLPGKDSHMKGPVRDDATWLVDPRRVTALSVACVLGRGTGR